MSSVTRTLLRTVLRWTQYPHVKYAPFRIHLAKVFEKHKSLQELKSFLPAGLESIDDAAGVRAAALYCYRTGAGVQSCSESEKLDVMFAAIKYLNSRSMELKVACNSREYRGTEEVVKNAAIRVGQVSL